MLIYLASRYSRAAQMQAARRDLQNTGHTVTSRWIDGGHELTKEGSTQAAHAERVRFAEEDWADLMAADCVVSFTEPPRVGYPGRGGRHVEFGAALATGKRCLVVGWLENVFHCLPQVEFFEIWDDALAALGYAPPLPAESGEAGTPHASKPCPSCGATPWGRNEACPTCGVVRRGP